MDSVIDMEPHCLLPEDEFANMMVTKFQVPTCDSMRESFLFAFLGFLRRLSIVGPLPQTMFKLMI